MQYGDEVNIDRVRIYFSGRSEDRTVNINGQIPLTSKEYKGNESVPALEGIVKEHVIEELQREPEEDTEDENAE